MSINKRDVRLLLAQKKVLVDGSIATDISLSIDHFSIVIVDGTTLQENKAHYIMMNKPTGVVSATMDSQHKTVIDLLDYHYRKDLHLVGRLDLMSSGLLLLTNDSRWSRQLTSPENKVPKQYRVTLEKPISEDYIQAFNEGMYFPYEDITTQPVKLEILNDYKADLTLTEGRYHQIKRMFGRFRNPVIELHRFAIGSLVLDRKLMSGESRPLSAGEIGVICN